MAIARPHTSRAVVFRAPGELRAEEIALPAPGPGELLLRITACGLCPGEVMDWYIARKAPVAMGHEAVGVVAAGGAGAPFEVGDRVFVHHHAPCLACRACRRGDYVHCAAWRSRQLIPGGLATYAIAGAEAAARDALRLPADLTDEAAIFIEPLACVVKSVRRARLRPEDRVLVLGCGVMGLLHLMVLRTRSEPSLIMAADRVSARLEVAARFADVVADVTATPLDEAVRRATGADGADVVIVGPGTVEALEAAAGAVAPGGTLVVFAPTPPEARWPLDVHQVFFRETTIVPTYSAGPDDVREAVRLLGCGLPVTELITHRLPLDQAALGYDLVRTASALKVVVVP
ncbi:MAG: alcohol dehydrogenase catalytic domain-containing protein [Armatimonadota bacterium]|nr:alcohol dehydrogenase catalytic domain-containing protein [Armatimonadota bacterium]